jgi:DNA-binding response OmpR family regulator
MAQALIIDDDAAVGGAVRLTLTRHGIEAVHVLDGYAGIQAFETASFDLVIVDLFMPKMSGIEIIRRFRGLAPTLPMLAMSGFRFREPMDPGLDFLGMAGKVGAAAVLSKPFTPSQLMIAVEAILKRPAASVGLENPS